MLDVVAVGMALGFVGSVPIAGPVSALVFRCGVDGRFAYGRGIAVGAAVAEAIYAFLAFLGFSTFLTSHAIVVPVSRAVGGVLLVVLGLALLRRRGERPLPPAAPAHIEATYSVLLGFSITGLNPTLIATWSAIAALLYSTELMAFEPLSASVFAAGVAVGITAWFVVLLALLQRYRERFEPRFLDRMVRGMGLIVFGLGAYFLVSLVPGLEPKWG